MNIDINISKNLTQYQVENNAVSLVGYIEKKNIINSFLGDQLNNKKFFELLKEEIKGFFSIVIKKDDQLYAAVDHIRSYPLFFGKDENNFYISDSAEWVRKKVKDLEMDCIAREEFQLAGYITGNDTLYPNVKQLQAGEFLIFHNNEYEIGQYYNFDHSEPDQYNEKELKNQLNKFSNQAIKRLINYANGRQIVIPLSGGYDSRLIATLLKQNGYKNVITFTYGINLNKEIKYSKLVAESLGFDWLFIKYSEKEWADWSKSKDNINYQMECANLVSVPHLQDCIAVQKLKEDSLIDQNAVFVPGHSGDMVAGSHIPSFVFNDLDCLYTKDDLVNHLYNKHYNLKKEDKLNSLNFKERILNNINSLEKYNAVKFANECEKFNWKNRQSKFICNSVRLYEYYGYDWWLPLWDREFINFFQNLPLDLRNHKWYVAYVSYVYEENAKLKNLQSSDNLGFFLNLTKKIIDKTVFLKNISRFIYQYFCNSDNFGWYAQFPDYKILKSKGYSYNGIVAFYYLKRINNDD